MKAFTILTLIASFVTNGLCYFPLSRCYVHPCTSTPYDIEWTREERFSTYTKACFSIKRKGCVDNSMYNCCNVLDNYLHRIVLSIPTQCVDAVQQVTVNGTRKTSGLYYSSSEIILTTLRIYGNAAENTEFCIDLTEPCPSLFDFCVDSDELCRFAIFDASMKCCPTCIMLDKTYV